MLPPSHPLGFQLGGKAALGSSAEQGHCQTPWASRSPASRYSISPRAVALSPLAEGRLCRHAHLNQRLLPLLCIGEDSFCSPRTKPRAGATEIKGQVQGPGFRISFEAPLPITMDTGALGTQLSPQQQQRCSGGCCQEST